MNASQLVPASQLARALGVKCLVYSDPGVGKTPVTDTAPRPVLCACEPGLRSMSASNTPTWEAYTPEKMKEFFDWLFGSHEAKGFDTVALDSVSQYAEIVLQKYIAVNKNLLKAYGEMSREVYPQLQALYFLQQKHVYMIAKKTTFEDASVRRARPYFPGQDLNVRVPHLFDEILHMEKYLHIPDGKTYPVFRSMSPGGEVLVRDRSGKLLELETANLTHVFTKAMS